MQLDPKSCPTAECLSLRGVSESLYRFVPAQTASPHPHVSDWGGLEWGWEPAFLTRSQVLNPPLLPGILKTTVLKWCFLTRCDENHTSLNPPLADADSVGFELGTDICSLRKLMSNSAMYPAENHIPKIFTGVHSLYGREGRGCRSKQSTADSSLVLHHSEELENSHYIFSYT